MRHCSSAFRRSRFAVRVGLVVALLVATVAACLPPPNPNASRLGVGGMPPSVVRGFEAWSGNKVTYVLDYTWHATWSDIANPVHQIGLWSTDPEHHHLVLSVAMLPDNDGDLATGATGAYDEYFRVLARNLVKAHLANTVIRLGWEFNGDWNRWGIVKADSASSLAAAHNYATYFQHIVTAMRNVPATHFVFDWTVNNGYSAIPAEAAYPGDKYVDYIGVDAYDMIWGPGGSVVPNVAQRWQILTTGYRGLNFWAWFAAGHRKRMSVSEWGLWSGNHGGGDNPTFISNMQAWFVAHNVVYECYFNRDFSQINTGLFPKASLLYRTLF